ncbi:hypothetical protein ACUXCC_002945 [Cytobacillus horneckiae]|uniref:hypothetical protein n=1 Tax=Cytobacillus horneckiae TaxID=549687 RepID=UPI0019D0C503|nr:hypothetical protein [Cytobacillus horneckiae]MBN6887753.1 hypothetical protein [Cytobacillus horneckiae]
MPQKYMLSRRKYNDSDSDWKTGTKGEIEYILTVLELNLESPELHDLEWRITPVNEWVKEFPKQKSP